MYLYGSFYFMIIGFYFVYVVVGFVIFVLFVGWIVVGFFGCEWCVVLMVGGFYWYFVDIVWLFIFIVLYVLLFWLRSIG